MVFHQSLYYSILKISNNLFWSDSFPLFSLILPRSMYGTHIHTFSQISTFPSFQ